MLVPSYAGRSGPLSTNGEGYPAYAVGANRLRLHPLSGRFQLFSV